MNCSRNPVLVALLSLLFVLLVCFPSTVIAVRDTRLDRNTRDFTGGTSWGNTREEIVDNRKRRRRQLRNMVNYMRKQLADHSAGEVILPAKEKSDIERRLDIFSRKLDMLQTDLQEMDIERILARSQLQVERRQAMKKDILSQGNPVGSEL